MVPLALMQWPKKVRGRRFVWYVGNASAMASFVKGASSNEHLEAIAGLFWRLTWHLDATVWFEWVDSDSNWSDGVSRELAQDKFAVNQGFKLFPMGTPAPWWRCDWPADVGQSVCGFQTSGRWRSAEAAA